MRKKYSMLALVGVSMSMTSPLVHAADEGSDGDVSDYPIETLTLITVTADPSRFTTFLPMDMPSISYLFGSSGGGISGDVGNMAPQDAEPPQPRDGCDTSPHPVVYMTGNKIKEEVDFVTGHQTPIKLVRTFNNFSQSVTGGLFGESWFSNFDVRLWFRYSDNSTCMPLQGRAEPCISTLIPNGTISSVYRVKPDGSQLRYYRNAAANNWQSGHPGGNETITRNADGSWVVQSKTGAVERYDLNGFVTSLTDPHGLTHTFTYSENRLQRVNFSNGKSVQFGWGGGFAVSSVTDPAGNVYTYNSDVHVEQVIYPGLPSVTRTYHHRPNSSVLTGISINGARYSDYDYFTADEYRVRYSGLAGGVERDSFIYGANADGSLYTQVTNAAGAVTKFSYRTDAYGRRQLHRIDRSGVTNCPNAATQTFYDANGNVDYDLDFNGNRTEYSYDASERLTDMTTGINSAWSGQQRRTEYGWDPVTNALTSVRTYGATTADPQKEVVYEYYDASAPSPRRIKSISVYNRNAHGVAGQLRKTTYTYTVHPSKEIATMVIDGPLAGTDDAVTYSYNATGELTSIANGLGHVTTLENYTGLGKPGRITNPNGGQIRYEYYPRGQVRRFIRVLYGVDVATSYTYDAFDNPLTTTYPGGRVVTLVTDALGRIRKRTDSLVPGGSVDFEYNILSKMTHETVYQSASVVSMARQWGYDEIGRLTSETGANGQSRQYRYDDNGNLKTVTDGSNNTTTYKYNSHNELVETVDANQAVTRVRRDAAGRPVQTTTPR